MAATITWDCGTVDTYPSHTDTQDPANTQTDVIYNVHFTVSGVETVNEQEYYYSVIGTQTLSVEDLTNFTTFENVVHSDLVTWTQAALGEERVQELEAAVNTGIAQKVTPSTVTKRINP